MAQLQKWPTGTPKGTHTRNHGAHQRGLGQLLDWLADHPGETWQDRWLATGVDTGGKSWRERTVTRNSPESA